MLKSITELKKELESSPALEGLYLVLLNTNVDKKKLETSCKLHVIDYFLNKNYANSHQCDFLCEEDCEESGDDFANSYALVQDLCFSEATPNTKEANVIIMKNLSELVHDYDCGIPQEYLDYLKSEIPYAPEHAEEIKCM